MHKNIELAISRNIHILKLLSIAVANREHMRQKMGYAVPLITRKIKIIFTQNFYMQNHDKFAKKMISFKLKSGKVFSCFMV